MHKSRHGYLKRDVQPPTHLLCQASTSQTADWVSLPGVTRLTTLTSGSLRDGVFWSVRLPLSVWAAFGLHGGNVLSRWKNAGHVCCCVLRLSSLQAHWTPGQDSRHWLDPESSEERKLPSYPTIRAFLDSGPGQDSAHG